MSVALLLHLIAVVVWVGGMFFALTALRPAAIATLKPPQLLPLMAATLARFFVWVGGLIAVILGSGFYMIAGLGGFSASGPHVHLMLAFGIAMILVFLYVRLVPFRRLQEAVRNAAWPDAGAAMGTIRRLVALNLVLGLLTIAVAVFGRAI